MKRGDKFPPMILDKETNQIVCGFTRYEAYKKVLKPEEKVPKIEIDKEKIAICVQNLLTNAIIYNKPKGKVTVSVKYDKKKKEVLIKVKDNGMGIPATQQKRIFSKFYRASSAIKKETSGSGLGLYITKNIIEAHNGEIWFKSKEGKGSTFYFILPINNH